MVDVGIPGYDSLTYLYGTTEERLYTLVESHSGTRKHIRFASRKYGRAWISSDVLKEYGVSQTPQPEAVKTVPDRGICAEYPFVPVETFREFSEEMMKLD